MYVIIVYDIAVERINRVRQYLRQNLNWVQNSAFEGELKEGELEKMKVVLKNIMEEKEDSLIIYKIPNQNWITKEVLGIEKSEITTIL